jgi:hypothetical protein
LEKRGAGRRASVWSDYALFSTWRKACKTVAASPVLRRGFWRHRRRPPTADFAEKNERIVLFSKSFFYFPDPLGAPREHDDPYRVRLLLS